MQTGSCWSAKNASAVAIDCPPGLSGKAEFERRRPTPGVLRSSHPPDSSTWAAGQALAAYSSIFQASSMDARLAG